MLPAVKFYRWWLNGFLAYLSSFLNSWNVLVVMSWRLFKLWGSAEIPTARLSLRLLESDEPPLVEEGPAETAGDDTASNVGVRRDNSNHFTFGHRGSDLMRKKAGTTYLLVINLKDSIFTYLRRVRHLLFTLFTLFQKIYIFFGGQQHLQIEPGGEESLTHSPWQERKF